MSTVPVPLPPAESQLSCLETAQSLGEGANLTSSIVGDGDSDRLPLPTPLRVAPYQPGLLFLEAGRAGSVGEESERTPAPKQAVVALVQCLPSAQPSRVWLTTPGLCCSGQKIGRPVPSSKTGTLKDPWRATFVDGPGSETIPGTFPG